MAAMFSRCFPTPAMGRACGMQGAPGEGRGAVRRGNRAGGERRILPRGRGGISGTGRKERVRGAQGRKGCVRTAGDERDGAAARGKIT